MHRKLSFYRGSKEKQRQEKSNLVQEHICLVSAAVSMQDKRKFAASLLATTVGDDTGSRYFWGLIDTATADTAAMRFEAMDGVGALYSYIRCNDDKAGEVMDIVRSIFADLASNGVSEGELEKAKNKVLSAITISSETPMGRLINLGFNWVYLKQYRSMAEDVEAIKKVRLDDVNELIYEFNPGDYTQLSIGPGKQDSA